MKIRKIYKKERAEYLCAEKDFTKKEEAIRIEKLREGEVVAVYTNSTKYYTLISVKT